MSQTVRASSMRGPSTSIYQMTCMSSQCR
jgi:hypothetical protein